MRLGRLLLPLALLCAAPAAAQMPHLEMRGSAKQLIVDGKPFLILGGELGNSSSSNRDYLKPSWAKLKAMHLNTVLVPVSWELIEPEEGKFDFSSVDWLLEDARAHGLRLVPLWFGAWKNSMSTYVPAWVKRDRKRFPYAIAADGTPQEILSAFGKATLDADSKAFAALMAHLRTVDKRGTVLMVQVENEIGFLPDAREHGPAADAAFAAEPPPEARDAKDHRAVVASWADVAALHDVPVAEEAFTAWSYARYAEGVAAAGKRAYPLPMYVNGAQGRPGKLPGEYPSGGPLAHLADIWKSSAPSIDFIAPDVYFPSFAGIVLGYTRRGNPLFVPEANNAGDPRAAANAMLVFGRHKGIGFSPFSIENIGAVDGERLTRFYAMIEELTPTIVAAQSAGRIQGFAPPVAFDGTVDDKVQTVEFGGYRFTANFIDPWTPRDKQQSAEHGALLVWLGGEDYLVAGSGVTFTVAPVDGKGRAGFDWVDEGRFVDGAWVAGRRLNGGQTHQGRHVRLPPNAFGIQKLRLYRY